MGPLKGLVWWAPCKVWFGETPDMFALVGPLKVWFGGTPESFSLVGPLKGLVWWDS